MSDTSDAGGNELKESIAAVASGDGDVRSALNRALQGAVKVELRKSGVTPEAPAAPAAPAAPVARAEPAASQVRTSDFFESPAGSPAPSAARPASGVEIPAAAPGPEEEIPEPPEVRDDPRAAKAWEHGKRERKELKAKYEAAQQQARELAQAVEAAKAEKGAREAELEKRNQ